MSPNKTELVNRLEAIGRQFLDAAQSDYPDQIARIAIAIGDALEAGHKVMTFGNGGSAADAQHLAGELVVKFQTKRKALAALSLVSDAALMTACANDDSFDLVFARQIEGLGLSGDVALGFSTSGRSPNVVCALRTAREMGLQTVLFTGPERGPACEFADLVLSAPGVNTARVQELHLAAYHLICEILDNRFTVTVPVHNPVPSGRG